MIKFNNSITMQLVNFIKIVDYLTKLTEMNKYQRTRSESPKKSCFLIFFTNVLNIALHIV